MRRSIFGFLFSRGTCADVVALGLEERSNGILREQVGRLREQLKDAASWNNQCAVRMARIHEENGRLRCESARHELQAARARQQTREVIVSMDRKVRALEAQLKAGGPVS
jgi:hypothetical protein